MESWGHGGVVFMQTFVLLSDTTATPAGSISIDLLA